MCSTKRTMEVIPEGLAEAEEEKERLRLVRSVFGRRKRSPLTSAIAD